MRSYLFYEHNIVQKIIMRNKKWLVNTERVELNKKLEEMLSVLDDLDRDKN